MIANGNLHSNIFGNPESLKQYRNAVITRITVTNNSIKCDACSFLDLEIKRLVLYCNSSFARSSLFLQLALVGFPSRNLLKFPICCHLLLLQLQPQCCLCSMQPLICDLSGVLNCPFLAGSQSVLCIFLLFNPFQILHS